ncbi:hypothetical protein SLA2020_025430 [Shorea laevis]
MKELNSESIPKYQAQIKTKTQNQAQAVFVAPQKKAQAVFTLNLKNLQDPIHPRFLTRNPSDISSTSQTLVRVQAENPDRFFLLHFCSPPPDHHSLLLLPAYHLTSDFHSPSPINPENSHCPPLFRTLFIDLPFFSSTDSSPPNPFFLAGANRHPLRRSNLLPSQTSDSAITAALLLLSPPSLSSSLQPESPRELLNSSD